MKKNLLIGLGVLAVVSIAFVSVDKTQSVQTEGGYQVGDKSVAISLKNVDGNTVSTADYQDAKGFIVVFTCNTCPYSKMYEQRIESLHVKYATQGYPVLAINSNDKTVQPGDSYEEMVKLAAEKNYSFPYLYDDTQQIAKTFGATRTPHIYLLSKSGNDLKVAYIGAIDNNSKDADAADTKYVEDAVNSLLKGETIKTDNTKAVGCTIKWKQA